MDTATATYSQRVDGVSVDIDRILLELDMLPDYKDQISLQGIEGQTDPTYGTGRITHIDAAETDFCYPLFDMTYVNELLSSLNMYRTRLMNMSGKTCYTYHQDYTRRVHIPLITNENCFFVIDDEVIRYPADGSVYIADTRRMHTFVNASTQNRLHLVGCIAD